MANLKCFVVTRFNLAIDYKLNDEQVNNKIWLDEKYLDDRLVLFQKYCVPSLVNQTDKDFQWIVMFHSDTSDRHKKIISEIIKQHPFMQALYLNDEESFNFIEVLQKYISEQVGEQAYITTRIDNDDMYHPTYIQEVKAQVQSLKKQNNLKSKHVISCQVGMQYSLKEKSALRLEWDCNHFLALYCDKDSPDHILKYDHTKTRQIFSDDNFAIVDNQKAMWVELINGSNVINNMKFFLGNARVPYAEASEYPEITLPWKDRFGWSLYVKRMYIYIFIKCAVGKLKRICKVE